MTPLQILIPERDGLRLARCRTSRVHVQLVTDIHFAINHSVLHHRLCNIDEGQVGARLGQRCHLWFSAACRGNSSARATDGLTEMK